MSRLVEWSKHPSRDGYMLLFDNGDKFSVVNLASIGADQRPDDSVGKLFDGIGGRYEAMQLPESNNGKWGRAYRGHSFAEVINKVRLAEGDTLPGIS